MALSIYIYSTHIFFNDIIYDLCVRATLSTGSIIGILAFVVDFSSTPSREKKLPLHWANHVVTGIIKIIIMAIYRRGCGNSCRKAFQSGKICRRSTEHSS